MPVSVVIPTLNEEESIGEAIDSAFAAGAAEVIVADGGSKDRTLAIARDHGARTIVCDPVRARQLNDGAGQARHEALIFLHADTILPAGAAVAVATAVSSGSTFGGFRLAFVERGLRLRYVAFMINARTRLTREPWGDQAQFASRSAFVQTRGYADMPIMEDYELARRMKRLGPTAMLPLTVRTSGRRFLSNGVVRTSLLNWVIVAAYHCGVAPEKLARWYRGATTRDVRSS